MVAFASFSSTGALILFLCVSAALLTTTAAEHQPHVRQQRRTARRGRSYFQSWWHSVGNAVNEVVKQTDGDFVFPKEESEDESDRTFHCGEWGDLVIPADNVEGEDGTREEVPCTDFPNEDSEDPALYQTAPPTFSPTREPTPEPTSGPTNPPTPSPTTEPTTGPVATPTIEPTVSPTETPTLVPTSSPVDLSRSDTSDVVVEAPPQEPRAADIVVESTPVEASDSNTGWVPIAIGGAAVVAVVGVVLGVSQGSAAAGAGTAMAVEEGAETVLEAAPEATTPRQTVFQDDAEIDV